MNSHYFPTKHGSGCLSVFLVTYKYVTYINFSLQTTRVISDQFYNENAKRELCNIHFKVMSQLHFCTQLSDLHKFTDIISALNMSRRCLHLKSTLQSCLQLKSTLQPCLHLNTELQPCLHLNTELKSFLRLNNTLQSCLQLKSTLQSCLHLNTTIQSRLHLNTTLQSCHHLYTTLQSCLQLNTKLVYNKLTAVTSS